MNLQELEVYLKECLKKNRKSLMCSIRNSKKIKNNIIEETHILGDVTISQRVWHIVNNTFDFPICEQCKINHTHFSNRTEYWGYLKFCSPTCAQLNTETRTKYEKTCLEKYGVDNIFKSIDFKENSKIHNLEKYGVEYTFQSDNNKNKSKQTCLKKYGVTSYTKTKECKEKINKKCIQKYGVDFYSQTDKYKTDYRNTCLERYGVDHVMQNDEICNKVLHACFKFKTFVLPSGKEIKLQGYENKFLDEYFKNNGSEENILVNIKDIHNKIGIIWYFTPDGKRHRYYPDFYLISENKIIEVKSTYTYRKDFVINLLKRDACLNNGLNFEFIIL